MVATPISLMIFNPIARRRARNRRRTVQKPCNVRCVMQLRFEGERLLRGPSSRSFLAQAVLKIWPNVQITCSRTAAEPLHGTAGGEVDIQLFDAEWHGAGGLVSVQHDHCADFVCAIGDRFRVLQKAALEKNMREGNEQRLFVDRRQHSSRGTVIPSSDFTHSIRNLSLERGLHRRTSRRESSALE